MNPRIPAIIITLLLLLFPSALFAEDGARLFEAHCSGCHGPGGEGGRAPALRKTGLLITVEQGYFVKSIRRGREVRGCPSFKDKISPEGIETVASHIKSWQTEKTLDAPAYDVSAMYTEKGERLFSLCGGCHGLEGEGAMGPPLLDPGFLESISDTELRRTIMHGRPGTPMKGFLKGMGVFATLSIEDIDGIISYMRYRQATRGIKDAERIKAP
jgi:cytochrome c oxidase cbb3-type subunit 3